jgi:anti-anti-sigma factor
MSTTPGQPAGPHPPAERASVLIVDDREANLVALEALLQPLGRRVVAADSGEAALRRLLEEDFALILLDVQMPGMDGFETARYIRARPRTRHVPIIFVTAISTASENIFTGYEAGAVDYILKPIDPVVLRSKVSVFLDLHEANARLRRQSELRAAHESLTLAQRAGMSGVWDWDIAAGRLTWSPELAELCGLGPSPPEREDAWLDVVDPRDRDRLSRRLEALLQRGDVWEEEYRVVHPRRGIRWLAARGRLSRSPQGAPERFTGIAFDVTERKRAEARVARLHEATAALSAAASIEDVVEGILAHAPGAAGARSATLWRQEEDAAGAGRWSAVPPDAAAPRGLEAEVARVARQGLPVEPVEDGRLVLLALSGQVGPPAVLALDYGRPGRPDEEARAFLAGFGAQCAQALERARLYDAERRARERTEALQRATAALVGAARPAQVVDRVVEEALALEGAVSVAVVAPGGVGGVAVGRGGAPDPALAAEGGESDGGPVGRCLREGAPIALADDPSGPLVAAPLEEGGRCVGALAVRFRPGRPSREQDAEGVVLLSRLTSQAMARARLSEERERERERMRFSADAGLALVAADLGVRQRLDRLAALVVPALADLCLIDLEEDGALIMQTVRSTSREAEEIVAALRQRHALDAEEPESIAAIVRSGEPVLLNGILPSHLERHLQRRGVAAGLAERAHRHLPSSILIVPMSVHDQPIGAITLVSLDPARRFDEDDARLATDLGRRAGLAIQNARLYEEQARLAITLQRSLLPRALPPMDGITLAARYISGAAGTEAGGDWFEAVRLDERRIVLAIGDVVGRGTDAAAVMGQLRSAMRAYATAGMSPSAILTQLSRLSAGVPGAYASTALCAELDVTTGELRYARAGHPPPLVIAPSGASGYLPIGRGSVLGFGPEGHEELTATLTDGSALVLYTDGAVERRGENLDRGFERLAEAASWSWPASPAALCDALVNRLLLEGAPSDDVALLVVKTGVPAPLALRVPAAPDQLQEIRQAVRGWLRQLPMGHGDREDVVLAVGEAVANAIEHGGGRAGGSLTVEAEWTADSALRILVRDDGSWLERAQDDGTRGRGLVIMRRIMDEVVVEADPEGTRVTMSLRPEAPGTVVVRAAQDAAGGPLPAPPAPATIEVADPNGAPRAQIRGELDGPGAASLRIRLAALVEEAPSLTLDMSEVEYLGSAGVALVWDVAADVEARGGSLLVIAPPGSRARRVLEMVGPESVRLLDAATVADA